jgi:hypothetical protein
MKFDTKQKYTLALRTMLLLTVNRFDLEPVNISRKYGILFIYLGHAVA